MSKEFVFEEVFDVNEGGNVELDTTLSQEGKAADAKAVGDALGGKVNVTDIVDNTTTEDATKPLSAKQGKAIKGIVDRVSIEQTAQRQRIEGLENKSLDNVLVFDFTNGDNIYTSIDGYGIYWENGKTEIVLETPDGTGSRFTTGESRNRVPIVPGDGITFEIFDNNVVRINADVKSDSSGGSNAKVTDIMTSVTYSELKALRDSSKLTPGMFYRITDYVCTTAQPDTRAMDNKFDIIVQALSNNTLSENAKADYHVEVIGDGGSGNDSIVGTWVFNERIALPGTLFDVVFISNESNYDSMDDYGGLIYVSNQNGVADTAYHDDDLGWSEEEYRTIEILEEPTDENFITWLKANATKQDGSNSKGGNYAFKSDVLADEEGSLVQGAVVSKYYIFEDVDEEKNALPMGTHEGYKSTDLFIAYGYEENNEGVTVPVIYKTDVQMIPENTNFENPDYEDVFYYVGTEVVDGVTYDKWRKINVGGGVYWEDDPHYSNEPGKIYALTNIVIENATRKYIFDSSVINSDGTLVDGAVTSYYKELVDYDDENYQGKLATSLLFIAYDYLENNDGNTVPVLYSDYEDDVDKEQPFYYVGRETIDGVEYDKWRKIEFNADRDDMDFGWDNVGKYYIYTNIIVKRNSIKHLANANIPAWELKYCLDNDTTRFAWAAGAVQAIVNLESGLSDGQPLTRQPDFDGKLVFAEPLDGYYYAWGTQGDVDDGDPHNFWYSKNEVLSNGETVVDENESPSQATVVEVETGKGVIYYMKDEHGNECPYDFKNIQFKRKVSLDNGYPELDEENGEETWVYTFCGNSYHIDNDEWSSLKDGSLESPYWHQSDENTSTFHHNVMKPYIRLYDDENEDYTVCGKQYLNNNVFFGYWEEIGSTNEEYPYYYAYCCYFNTLGGNCSYNTFGSSCEYNSFGNRCVYNTLGSGCGYNTFGDGCVYNALDGGCGYNTFGSSCEYNSFGKTCNDNTLGNECGNNTLGLNCYSNSFGENCRYNTFSGACGHNTIDPGCQFNNIQVNSIKNIHICKGVSSKTLTPEPDADYEQIYRLSGSKEILV